MTDTMKTARREVTLPAASLVELLGAARAGGDDELRARGRAAGAVLAERLLSPQDGANSTRALPSSLFWKRVGEIFAGRGWGSLTHAAAEPGLGELRSIDWIEADRAGGGTCAFTAGVIQGLLEAVAGSGVEVEERECRAAGASACRFLFGTRAALDAARAGTTTR